MIEIQGDFFKTLDAHFEFQEPIVRYDAIVCTINNVVSRGDRLVMGAGIAQQFKYKYPDLPDLWGKKVQNGQLGLISTKSVWKASWAKHDLLLIGFPTKENWKKPSRMEMVVKSAKELKWVADFLDLKKVLMPRPGCGLGGLRWEDVKREISFLDERFVVINNE
jgi:hypothetical protein